MSLVLLPFCFSLLFARQVFCMTTHASERSQFETTQSSKSCRLLPSESREMTEALITISHLEELTILDIYAAQVVVPIAQQLLQDLSTLRHHAMREA